MVRERAHVATHHFYPLILTRCTYNFLCPLTRYPYKRALVCFLITRYEPSADGHDDAVEGSTASADANNQMTLPVEICLTSMECAQFKVSGIDVDALHAKAKAVSIEGHRRALQMAESGCTDATPFVDALVAVIYEAGRELEDVERKTLTIMDDMNRTDDIGSGEDAEEEGEEEGKVGNMTSEGMSSRRLFQLPGLQRRRLGAPARSPQSSLYLKYLVNSGVLQSSSSVLADQWKQVSVPESARSSACGSTKNKVDNLRTRLNNVQDASENLEEDLEALADDMEDVVDLNNRLRQAKTAIKTVGTYVDFIKCCGGPIQIAGTIARPMLDVFEDSVDAAYSRLDPFVKNKLVGGWKLQQKLEDVRRYNNNAREKVEMVHDSFHHYAYPCNVEKVPKSVCVSRLPRPRHPHLDPPPPRPSPHKLITSATDGAGPRLLSLGQRSSLVVSLGDLVGGALCLETAFIFLPQRYKVVLIADNICPSATASALCTPATNNALQSVMNSLDSISFPPKLSVPNVFNLLSDFMSLNIGIINALSMEAFIDFLQPIYDFLTKERCFVFIVKFCFRIADIFDNWLVRFVSGIIDDVLKPVLEPIKELFRGFALPSLPSLDILQPSWSLPGFSIDFNVNILDFPCLTYDHTADAVKMHCFDFPSLSVSIPFISNPFQFLCDEDCDSSCDSDCNDSCDSECNSGCDGSCDQSCNECCDESCDYSCGKGGCDHSCDSSCDCGCDHGCDSDCNDSCDNACNAGCKSSCNDGCDSSCDFVATCGISRRRVEDSLESITSEPKAIGWSERLAAAAAKESN